MNCTVMLEPRRGGRKKPNYFDHLFPDPERWLKKAEPSIEQPGLFRPPFRGWSKKAEQPLLGSELCFRVASCRFAATRKKRFVKILKISKNHEKSSWSEGVTRVPPPPLQSRGGDGKGTPLPPQIPWSWWDTLPYRSGTPHIFSISVRSPEEIIYCKH